MVFLTIITDRKAYSSQHIEESCYFFTFNAVFLEHQARIKCVQNSPPTGSDSDCVAARHGEGHRGDELLEICP